MRAKEPVTTFNISNYIWKTKIKVTHGEIVSTQKGKESKKIGSNPKKPKVSVLIPTLNEEQSIGQTLDEIPKDFAQLELIIIDGLSTDRTVEIAKKKGAKVVMEKRKGYGRAYKSGFQKASGDIIVTLDGDTTYPAYDIPRVVKMLIDENLDFITCDRLSTLKKEAMTKKHRFGNWLLAKTTNVLFFMHIKDSQSGMWVFRREILKQINLTSDGMPLSEEIKIETFKNKIIKAIEIPVEYRIRIGDIKLDTWGDGIGNWKFLWRKRFRPRTLTPEKFT
jgi:glycosyltransferase involved in cell wall biosynthesis